MALLTLCAAVIIGLGTLVDYRLTRDELLERLQRESDTTIRAAMIDMESWLQGVESSTLLLARVLQQRDYSQAGLQQMLRDVVEVNGDIFGATIALAPQAQEQSAGFAPYYFRRAGKLEYVDLADPQYNYQHQAWFTDTLAAGKPLWVEPYFDAGGGEVLMTTFAVPVYREDTAGRRFLYAVVTADVSLAELDAYLQRLRLGSSGFGFLLSRKGIILSSRNPDNVTRHFTDVLAGETDQAGWQQMYDAALQGQVTSRQLACSHVAGSCVIRLGALAATGWPVGVLYSEEEMTAPLREYKIRIALAGLLTLLLMAAAVALVTRRLTRPLTALAQASDCIARGDLEAPLPPAQGDDEVARLVRSFAAMKRDLKSYIADLEAAAARRSRLEGELDAAREIQMAMLPHGGEAGEQGEGYSLWARVLPARSVGGDLYSYHCRDRRLFIAVGDVSDKGVPAALFMARAISLIQQLATTSRDPAVAMAALNNALASGNENCMFVTLFLGIVNLDTLELHFSSAGHTRPSLVRAGRALSIEQEQGPALGLAAQLDFPRNLLQLQDGDRLAIFTDGIDEAFNEEDEMFGLARFNEALLQCRALPAAAAGASLFAALRSFTGETPQSDDICLLLLGIGGDAPSVHATIEFARGPGLAARVDNWLRQVLAPLLLSQQVLGELVLVAEEVVSNADKYAGLAADAAITVTVAADSMQVALEVRDAGLAFDPLLQAQQSALGAAIDDAAIGGLGVHLITALTDHQSYHRADGCNILRLIKLLEHHPDPGVQ